MRQLDTTRNRRIPVLMDLVSSMHRYTDPGELMDGFLDAMWRAYGSRCLVQLSTRGLAPGEYRILRLRTHDDVEHVDYRTAWRTNDCPVHRGGIFGEVITSNMPKVLYDLDLAADSVLGGTLAPYKSLMASPLIDNEYGLSWIMVLAPEARVFNETHLEEMLVRANLLGAIINNLVTTRKLAIANERIQREIDAIGRIQRTLLPDGLPEIPGLRLAASYRTFDRAGGDFYDIARLGARMAPWQSDAEGRWAILIGDVSGHGPAAAVVMAMFQAILHAYPTRPNGPAEVLQYINRHLCATRIEQSFVTAFMAFYDPATRELTYARAGHNPPLLKDFPHQGPPAHLDAVGDLPLSIFHDVAYHETTITLYPGQTLILYTDGISEARRPGGKLFGVEGIEHSLIACTGAPECAIRHIQDSLQAHQTDVRPDDDQTIVAIQVV